MDTGFRLSSLISLGIIEDTDDEKNVFADLSPKYKALPRSDTTGLPVGAVPTEVLTEVKNVVIPTSVAEIDQYGVAKEIDFTENNMADIGKTRRNYATYLSSKVVAANKNSKYPVIKSEYGNLSRNYEYLSFWDYLDCTALMYLTFDISGNGFSEDGSSFVNALKSENGTEALSSALTGIWQIAKLIFMVFPFGLLSFIFFIMIAVAIFLLLARATLIFILFMFDVTKKKAKDTWMETLKSNLLGCCVPFVSLSLFMFVLDWVMFGDSNKYIERTMFDSNGVSMECYKGYEKEAPIACLTKRLTTEFHFWKTIGSSFMLIFHSDDGGFVKAQWTMMGFLLLRLLIGLVVFVITALISNEMETKLYSFVKKPDTSAGFNTLNGGVADMYKMAGSAGWESLKGSAKVIAAPVAVPIKIGKAIYDKVKGAQNDKQEQKGVKRNNDLGKMAQQGIEALKNDEGKADKAKKNDDGLGKMAQQGIEALKNTEGKSDTEKKKDNGLGKMIKQGMQALKNSEGKADKAKKKGNGLDKIAQTVDDVLKGDNVKQSKTQSEDNKVGEKGKTKIIEKTKIIKETEKLDKSIEIKEVSETAKVVSGDDENK